MADVPIGPPRPPPKYIYSLDAWGNPVKAPYEKAAEITALGNRPIGEEEALAAAQASKDIAYVDENWGSAGKLGMGALSGLSLGLAPGMLAEAGLVDRGHLQAAQTSPLYTAGDVAGTIAPALLSGGESLAARALEATPAGMLGSVGGLAEQLAGKSLGARMAARGAAEGAILNTGHAVGESMIQDRPLAAEALAASAIDGALFGGLVGGGFGVAGALGSAAVDSVSRFAGKVAVGADGGISRVAADLGQKLDAAAIESGSAKSELRQMGELLEAHGSRVGDSAVNQYRAAQSAMQAATEAREAVVASLEAAQDAVPDFHQIGGLIDEKIVIPASGTPGLSSIEREVASVKSELENVWPHHDIEPVKVKPVQEPDIIHTEPVKVNGYTKPEETLTEPVNVPAEKPMSKKDFEYQESSKPLHERQTYESYKANLKPGYDIMGVSTPAERVPGYEIMGVSEPGRVVPGYEIPGMRVPTGENPGWSQLVAARDEFAATANTKVRKQVLDILDSQIENSMKAASKEGAAKAYAEATSKLELAKRLDAGLAAKVEAAASDANAGSNLRFRDVATSALVAASGSPLTAAGWLASKGVSNILSRRAQSWMAQQAFERSIAGRAASATSDVKSRIGRSVENFFKTASKTPSKAAPAVNANMQKRPYDRTEYEAKAARVQQLISDAHMERVGQMANQMAKDGYPQLGAELMGVNQRAVMYLMHAMPKRKGAGTMGSLRPQPVSKSLSMEEHRFDRILRGANPMNILDDFESGKLSSDSVRMAWHTFPEFKNQVVGAVVQKVTEMKASGGSLPLDKVQTLGVLLDTAIDRTLEGDYVGAVQTALNQVPKQNQPPQRNQQSQPRSQTMQGSGLLTPLQNQMV